MSLDRLLFDDGTNTHQVVSAANPLPIGGGSSGMAVVQSDKYETVAASQSNQVMGTTGAIGDVLSGVLIVPATTSPGQVSIKDGGGSPIVIFFGGATSVGSLVSFTVSLGITSVAGAWSITTGAAVSAIGIGRFT